MSQHDLVIDNSDGLTVRLDINQALQALGSLQMGAAAPSPTYPCQFWADSGTGKLWLRNTANTAWNQFGTLNAASNFVPIAGGTMTGGLTIAPASGPATLTLTAIAGQSGFIQMGTTGAKTWTVGPGPGGNFNINDLTDGNTNWLSINPAGLTSIYQLSVGAGGAVINSPLTVNGVNGYYFSTSNAVRTWLFGADNGGNFIFNDQTAGSTRVYITSAGLLNVGFGMSVAGNVSFSGAITTSSSIVATANIIQSNIDLGVRVTAPSGSHGTFYSTVTGARSWRIGCFNDGTFHIYDASAPRDCFNIDTAGNVNVPVAALSVPNSQISCGTNLLANGGVYPANAATGSTFALFRSGTNRYLQYATSWYWYWQEADGLLAWNNPSAANRNVQFSPNGNCVNATGAWISWSDGRVKQDIEDYRGGLDAICALRPRRFRFKAEVALDEDMPFRIGLVGQEAEAAMPEAVEIAPHSYGDIDYDDFRHVNTGPVLWALVNAVKELSARVEALEATKH